MATLMDPLPPTRVTESRTSLSAIPLQMIADVDSFSNGDQQEESAKPSNWHDIEHLRDSSRALVPDDISRDTDSADSTFESEAEDRGMKHRWAAELQESESTDVGELVGEAEVVEQVVQPLADREDVSRDIPTPKLKRRGSNDLVPVVPPRRGSMGVGTVRRQSSFASRKLSEKGTSIEMTTAENGAARKYLK